MGTSNNIGQKGKHTRTHNTYMAASNNKEYSFTQTYTSYIPSFDPQC